jgi:hypothetical protein
VPVLSLAALHFTLLSLEPDERGFLSLGRSVMQISWALFDLAFQVAVGPLLAAIVARWFGGHASPADIREAIVWSYVPFSVAVFVSIP